MKFPRYCIALFTLLLVSAIPAHAQEQVPYAHQVNNLMNYYRVTPNIASSGAVTQSTVNELIKHGFQTVIDFRTEVEGTAEEKKMVKSAGMTYINIPIGADGVNESQLAAFKEALTEAELPILMHCATGSRAGAMWTAYQLSEGAPAEKAFKQGRASGMSPGLEKKIRETWCHGEQEGC